MLFRTERIKRLTLWCSVNTFVSLVGNRSSLCYLACMIAALPRASFVIG